MRTENSIIIRAPLKEIFATTSDLLRWPEVLPHYRWIRVLQQGEDGWIVKMGARRGWLPIRWTSRFVADGQRYELRFHHLKAFTKGMEVKWTYTPTGEGVLVRITHELERSSAPGRWFARRILGRMFVEPVASRTLRHFKAYLEQTSRS